MLNYYFERKSLMLDKIKQNISYVYGIKNLYYFEIPTYLYVKR